MDTPGMPDTGRTLRRSILTGIVVLAILMCAPALLAPAPHALPGISGTGSPSVTCPSPSGTPFAPCFTDPARKLAETKSPVFTDQLFREAVSYEPLLNTNGTQVHMGFWSGRGNHGSLVVLLDAVNDRPLTGDTAPPQKAIWDEGATTSNQYPSYVMMLDEHWYERATPANGTVHIYGTPYTDPYPVSLAQADEIWGQYSERYADMAGLAYRATGKPVKVWCFVEGARANRVFYTYELPELRRLESEGAVQVFFARTCTANWTIPSDWIEGTANAPVPVM